MEQIAENENQLGQEINQLVTFSIGDAMYGIDILRIQEINKIKDWTMVPQSMDFVLGILSLRGQIVTIIDLRKRLGLGKSQVKDESRNIIVNSKSGESIGFLIDNIGDVVSIKEQQICQPPANVNGVRGKFFSGILKTDNQLVAILNVEALLTELKEENTESVTTAATT